MKKIIKEYQKRFKLIMILILLIFIFLFIFLFNIQVINYKQYNEKYVNSSENIIDGSTAPRGKIYDRNGKLIVDNKPVKTIYYKKLNGVTTKDEIALAYKLASLIDVDYHKITSNIKKDFWIRIHADKAKDKISEQELIKLKYRKLTGMDIERLKKERITDDELNSLSSDDLEAAYIYYLMNKGYSYSEKIISSPINSAGFFILEVMNWI